MRRRHPRLGLLLGVLGVLFLLSGVVTDDVGAQTSDDDAPVIGEDPDSDGDDPGAVEDDDDQLAMTGSWDRILTPAGLTMILAGTLLTMVGQPARPRGRHSAPATKLRSSHAALLSSSIGGSLASVRRRR